MKQATLIVSFLFVQITFLRSQCLRNEIGFGPGIAQFYINENNIKMDGGMKDMMCQNSRINPRSVSNTQKVSSISAPSIYYGYKINRSLKFRSSLNFYQEKRELGYLDCLVGEKVTQYDATFNQLRLSTGISKNLSNCSCMKTYMSADLVHYLEFANEKSIQNRVWETGVNMNESVQSRTTTYSIGFNPSIGIRKRICRQFSLSYEAGAEIKYNTGKYSSFNFVCIPMNRLSLNYSL